MAIDAVNGGDVDAPDGVEPPDNSAVFAHTSDALYRVDPNTLQLTLIGDFIWPNGSDSMTDIAIDRFGRMLGVSFSRVYEVDEQTGNCIFLSDLSSGGFNGLSFLPADDDPANEILIGADQLGDVYELDPGTGVATLIGNYGGGITSSGDLVSVLGAGTFATVNNGPGTDYLARIDPANGYAATIVGDTGYDSIWGLGYWRNKVYGFAATNEFLVIDVNTGAATPEPVDAVEWWGAGVTTLAPIIE